MALDLPASLAPRVLNALKADPRTVDLRALCPHFYELAARTLDLFEEDAIVDVLSEVGGFLWGCGLIAGIGGGEEWRERGRGGGRGWRMEEMEPGRMNLGEAGGTELMVQRADI